MSIFNDGDYVIVNEGKTKDELAVVAAVLPGAKDYGFYEVNLLSDHEPGSGYDPVRVFGDSSLRLASENEIAKKRKEWEKKHNHTLPK